MLRLATQSPVTCHKFRVIRSLSNNRSPQRRVWKRKVRITRYYGNAALPKNQGLTKGGVRKGVPSKVPGESGIVQIGTFLVVSRWTEYTSNFVTFTRCSLNRGHRDTVHSRISDMLIYIACFTVTVPMRDKEQKARSLSGPFYTLAVQLFVSVKYCQCKT